MADAQAAGTSTASAASVATAASAFTAAGSSTAFGVGVMARQGVGLSAGSSAVTGANNPTLSAYGQASGSSTAAAISLSGSIASAYGSCSAQAAGVALNAPAPYDYQGIRSTRSNFVPGPSGSYIYSPAIGDNHCGQPHVSPDPLPPLSYTWRASKQNARVVDLNADGNVILIGRAGALFGGDRLLYLSSNTGQTWLTLPVTADTWVNVTVNAAGNLMAAYPLVTQVTYSSFDCGASWSSSPRPWTTSQTNGVEIAKDGSRTILTANPGNNVYLSANNGITWQAVDTGLLPALDYFTCSCLSFNTATMFAGRALDKMYRSVNGGATWQVCSNSFASQFSKVACDWTGNYVVATSDGATSWFQVSRDAGSTWTKYSAGTAFLTCAVSGNGRIMAAATYGGSLLLSTDYGLTWAAVNVDGVSGSYLWTDIAINYDGRVIAACAVDGPLYIGTSA